MIKSIHSLACIAALAFLTGCSGLSKMKVVEFDSEVGAGETLVNIVRRNAFLGDGAQVDVWDGDKTIGSISPG